MNTRGQRALLSRNKHEVAENVPTGPREEDPVESDTEEEEIIEEREVIS